MIRDKALRALKTTKFRDSPYFPTVADCHLWTGLINHLLYAGALPKYRKITVRRMCNAYAECSGYIGTKGQRYCKLEVHQRFPSFAIFYSILLHELVHFWEFMQRGEMDHGEFFLSHEELAAKVGVSLRASYTQKPDKRPKPIATT